jgi:hypothetical protein
MKSVLFCAMLLWVFPSFAGDAGDAARAMAGLKEVAANWNAYESKIGRPMQKWACQELGDDDGVTVFYPFSGPDLPTPVHLYPDADRYVLVSIEKAEAPPASRRDLEDYLAAFSKIWRFYGTLGFFRTEDLEASARRIGMTGPLMAFSVLLGFQVESVEPIRLEKGGQDFAASPGGEWDSVRLTLRKGGRRVLVDYVSMDLRDGWLKQVKHERDWIELMASHPTVLKAASHLPQDREFTIVRDSILLNAPVVVQDETGIEYRALSDAFAVRLYGRFTRPNGLFGGGLQSSLAAAYRAGGAKPLPFQYGYEKDAGSALQVAVRNIGARASLVAGTRCPAGACRRC